MHHESGLSKDIWNSEADIVLLCMLDRMIRFIFLACLIAQ